MIKTIAKMGTLVFVLVFLVLFPGMLLGQNTTGTIVGHITDPTGAAVVAARVSIVNQDTKETRSATTSGTGDFTVPLLKIGPYAVTIEANGFKTETKSGIQLNVDQVVRSDMALSLGAVTEAVNVAADALTLDTDSASVGQVIEGKQIVDLPLNGRNFQDLLFLTPGATNNSGGFQSSNRVEISGDATSSISLGGARGTSNGYSVDGSSIIDVGEQTPAFWPSIDDIAEFKTQTQVYSAAYGFAANQINVSSKQGTNSYHGTGFEFLRNNYVDADPFGYVPGTTISLLQQNQFGYSLGGPVRIPRLYDGRNKTFFFANYEGFRFKVAGTGSAIVPTTDEMKGVFSPAVLGNVQPGGTRTDQCGHTYNVGDALPLFDPMTGCPFALGTDGNYTIPSSRVSGIGTLAMRPGLFFPASGPNISGAGPGQPNFSLNNPSQTDYDQQNYRIDQNIGSKDQIFFHMVWHDLTQPGSGVTPASGLTHQQPARFYTMTETHVFTPNLTNQFRVGFLSSDSTALPIESITNADLAALHLANPYQIPQDGYPELQFDVSIYNDSNNISNEGYEFAPSFDKTSTWDGGDSAIYTWHRHTFNFGFELRKTRYTNSLGGGLGRLDFSGEYSGDPLADVELGATSGFGVYQVGNLGSPTAGLNGHYHMTSWAPYVQDDWKVTQRLTLNLGLRYEYTAVPFEEQNDLEWTDFDAPGGAMYVPDAQLVKDYAGTNPFGPGGLYVTPPGGERGNGPAPKADFAPRIGFAYRPFGDDKTVVRGGYGLFYDGYENDELHNSSNFYPLSTYNTSPALDAPLTYPNVYASDSLPAAPAAGPVISYSVDSNPTLSFLVTLGGKFYNPYVENWALDVQRELPLHTLFEIGYVGNHSVHLFGRQNPNQSFPCNASTGCTIGNQASGYAPSVSNNARTPYQNLGFLVNAQHNGWGNYDALDAKLEHRAKDLTLLAAYTWSKQMDVASSVTGQSGDEAGWAGPQDSHHYGADYARGTFDVGQNLAVSAVYALPIGRGMTFLPHISRLADEAVGGWQVGAIGLFTGGLPFTIQAGDYGGTLDTYSERADQLMPHPPAGFHKSVNGWFSFSPDFTSSNPSAQFTQPDPGLFGSSQRDAVRGPGVENIDLSAFKTFKLWEGGSFQFRGDAFNAFNHYNPGLPDTTVDDPINGGVIFRNAYQHDARILQGSIRLAF